MTEGTPERHKAAVVPFTRSIQALAVAPLVGTAILAGPALMAGPAFLFALFYVAPFAYGAAPHSRVGFRCRGGVDLDLGARRPFGDAVCVVDRTLVSNRPSN